MIAAEANRQQVMENKQPAVDLVGRVMRQIAASPPPRLTPPGAHPLGDLALELQCKRRRAVSRREAVRPVAVGLERPWTSGVLHPSVASEPER